MRLPLRWLPLLLSLSFSSTACTSEQPTDEAEEFLDGAEVGEPPAEGGKEDHLTFPLTPLELPLPASVGDRETRLLIRNQIAYRALFGASAPPVNFSTTWVVFYAAGRRPTGGYQASIDRVWTSASGLTLRIDTSLRAPGPNCIVTFATSRPHVAVAFPRPSLLPAWLQAFHTSTTVDCPVEPACRPVAATDLGALDLTVTRKVRAVYFVPSDRPFRDCLGERLDNFARLAHDFYGEELAAEGYPGKNFRLDAAADGTWNVVYMVGEHDAAYYQAQPDAPGAAMEEMIRRLPAAYHQLNVTLYIYDLATVDGRRIMYSGNGGSGAPWEGEGSGYVLQGAHFLGVGFDTIAVDPAQQALVFEDGADSGVDELDGDQTFGPLTRGEYASTYVGAALHELGHAFYLDHIFTDYDGDGIETNVMGHGFRRLSGRYTPRGYLPATGLGPDHAAALDQAWMFQP